MSPTTYGPLKSFCASVLAAAPQLQHPNLERRERSGEGGDEGVLAGLVVLVDQLDVRRADVLNLPS